MTYKRRKNVRGDGHLKKSWRTKRRTKDLDEIDEDIKDENAKKLLNQEIDLDKPGAAQHYCVHCATSKTMKKTTRVLTTMGVDLDTENYGRMYLGIENYGAMNLAIENYLKKRYFVNERSLDDHFRTKVHKRRLKALEIEPYTIEESERAAGQGNWQVAKKRKIETLTAKSIDEMDADGGCPTESKVTRIGE